MQQKIDIHTANNEGLKLYESGDFQKAISIFDRIIQINPDDDAAIINKGLCFDALERFEEAIQCYDIVITNSPIIAAGEISDVYYYKGIAHFYLRNYVGAIESFQKDIEYNKNDINSRSNIFLGLCYFHTKEYETSIQYSNNVLSEQPGNIDALNNKGICYLELQQYNKADDIFDTIIVLQHDYATAYFNKAIIQKYLKNNTEAKKMFEKVKLLDTNFQGLNYELSLHNV